MDNTFPEGKVWKAALYARLSREDEASATDGGTKESDSIANQKDLIRSFVESKRDIILTGEYEDDGHSGVDFQRPAFQRMLEDIRNGLIDCVISKDLSRLGRNYIETGKLLERFFPFMGVRFIAIIDNYDSQNHNTQTDSLIIPFKNLINDAFCADISRKIRSQLEIKRKKGDFIGSFTAYGYIKAPDNRNKLVIDENTAPVVRDIFRWKIEGNSQQGIADKLNELGVLSPLEYKKSCGSRYTTTFNTHNTAKWTAVAVGRILKNELYTGVLTQGMSTTPNYKVRQRVQKTPEDWIRVDQTHDHIISKEDFQLVGGLLKKDTRIAHGQSTVYLFSGMLFCGDCGQNLVRKIVPDRGNKYVYHVCSTYKKGESCKSHNISEIALYNAVYETITLHIRECAQISRVLSFIENMPLHSFDVQKFQKQIENKQTEIEKLHRRMVKLYEDFADGIINKDEYISFKDAFARQTDDAEKALAKLEQSLNDKLNNQSQNCLWIEYFKKHQDIESLTRNVIVELIEHITVFEGGKIEVHFRYQADFENALRYIESLPTDNGDCRYDGKAVV